jgi:glucosamine--fructose-6-phosphate aminotransferase (isomerizing)
MTARAYAPDVATTMGSSLDLQRLSAVVEADVAAALADPRIAGAKRIVMGGSGDSWFAALSTAPALRRWTGLPVEARTAMELARYEAPMLGPDDLVVSISNSGSSSRAREAVLLAKDRGVPTLGVTGSRTGPLAQQADRILHRPVHEAFDVDPSYGRCFLNMAEWYAVLYALYRFGLAFGVARGALTTEAAARELAAIVAAIGRAPEIAADIEPGVAELAASLDGVETIWTIGAGPSRGTAQYCAAKFHEQMPINGVATDLEEWAHLEYFLTLAWGARSVVFVIAPPGNGLDRAREMTTGISAAGGRAVVVTSGPRDAFGDATAVFDVGEVGSEWISPLTCHLPTQLLVLHMAARAGITPIPLKRRDGAFLIAGGLVRSSVAGLD